MRIIKIGKRQFALELNWNDSFGDDAQEAVLAANGESTPSLYTVVEGHDGDCVLGYAKAGDTKGPVYSYAQALAKRDADGVYAAPLGAGQVWFVAIIKGVVVAGSDRTMEAFEAEDEVRDILRNANIPLFAADGCLADLDDLLSSRSREVIPFDLEKIVAKIKVKPLKQTVRAGNSLVGALVLAAVVAGLGYGGWAMFFKKPDSAVDPVVMAAEARAAYIAAAGMELANLPGDAEWASNAYRGSILSFPSVISGWVLDGVTCQPTSCSGIYSLDKTASGYSIAAVYKLFDRQNVSLLPDKKSLNVRIEVPVRPSAPYTEEEIYNPAPSTTDVVDVLGALTMKFAEVMVDGEVKSETLNQGLSAPADAPMLYRETFATKYTEAIDLVMVRTLTAFMAETGFVANTISYSRGSGAVSPSWRIEWVRVHGGDR